jgi:hypothetical protein
MTTVDQTPIQDVRPVPLWKLSRRNQVKITYMGNGSRTPKTFVGRIVAVGPEVITMLHLATGEPMVLNRDRIRGCVVMVEGDVAGRARMSAVQALGQAARALAETDHVGGDIKRAGDLIAFVLEMFPEMSDGNPEVFWELLQKRGVEIE